MRRKERPNPQSNFFGPDHDELAGPAHRMVLETTSRNQGSELSGAPGRLKAKGNQQIALHPISVPEREGKTA